MDTSQRPKTPHRAAAGTPHPVRRRRRKKQQLNSGTVIRVIALVGMAAVLVLMMMLRKFKKQNTDDSLAKTSSVTYTGLVFLSYKTDQAIERLLQKCPAWM